MPNVFRAKAPLRLGLAGGGTDVSPYSTTFGGLILNATINMYAYASIEPLDEPTIEFISPDQQTSLNFSLKKSIPTDHDLPLHAGIYNRIIQDFTPHLINGFRLYSHVDAPAGSGLGTSSTLATAILGAFVEWLRLPLGEYDMARLAYEIERVDLGMSGGKQDQYAATFGGVNFMEFHKDDSVIVNPLRIRTDILNELSTNLLLFYTNTSRKSAAIIEHQKQNVHTGVQDSIQAMHQLKADALEMKQHILRGDLQEIGPLLHKSWQSKKRMADSITNPKIDALYEAAMSAGATGGKISGAGGGGFMFFYCPGQARYSVIQALQEHGATYFRYEFVKKGLETWKNHLSTNQQ